MLTLQHIPCRSCGTPVLEGCTFCGQCGARQSHKLRTGRGGTLPLGTGGVAWLNGARAGEEVNGMHDGPGGAHMSRGVAASGRDVEREGTSSPPLRTSDGTIRTTRARSGSLGVPGLHGSRSDTNLAGLEAVMNKYGVHWG